MHKRTIVSMSIIAVLLLSSISVLASQPLAQPDEPDALDKIEPQLLQELSLDSQTEFFVWMTEQADLSPAFRLKTRQQRGRFVYETLRATADRAQAPLRAHLDSLGVEYRAFYIANKVLVYGGTQTLLMNVAARSDVVQITANHPYQLQEPVEKVFNPTHILGVESNVTFINADDVWALGYDGDGTVMAGNDTGLDETHPTIARHYRGCLNPPTCSSWDHNYNWWDATGSYPTNPDDGHGHGTHTTGTMVGDDGGSNQIGVAPGAQTVHCKNMTDSGSGSDATFTECLEWDLAPWDLNGQNANPDLAPDAVNNSWGYWGGNDPVFRNEVQALHAAGILVEVSAGNEGSSCATLRSPGDYWETLTTGSVNHASSFPGTITGFSSRGPSDLDGNYFPDIMAPGENIRSSLPGNSYASWGGTSMAGPHATALVGLIWSACPAYQGDVYGTIDLIIDTAVPLSGQTGSNCGGNYTNGPNNDWGYGTIDALAAVQACIGGSTPTPSPTPTATPEPGVMHVDDIAMSIQKSGRNRYGVATVTIVDAGGASVAGATVYGTFSGSTSDSVSGVTDANGQVTLTSSGVKNKDANWTFCVDDVVKSGGWTYDAGANVETCDSTGASPTPTPTPTVTPESGVMHVGNIAMSYQRSGANYRAKATVMILDAGDAPVAGATVYGAFSGSTSDSVSGVTDANGRVTLKSSNSKRGGSWTFCVEDVAKSGWSYDSGANVETCDSIVAP